MMKKILASGVFDILHLGHIYYLNQAKKRGDYLMVVVASDSSAKKRGKKLLFNQKQRLEMIKNLKMVDRAVVGKDKVNWVKTIQELQPDIIALGFDQTIDAKKLKKKLRQNNWQGQVVRIKKMPYTKISSTKIKNRLARKQYPYA